MDKLINPIYFQHYVIKEVNDAFNFADHTNQGYTFKRRTELKDFFTAYQARRVLLHRSDTKLRSELVLRKHRFK